MLQERIDAISDPVIRKIVTAVIELEKRHISSARPRVHNEIDQIITQIAKSEVDAQLDTVESIE